MLGRKTYYIIRNNLDEGKKLDTFLRSDYMMSDEISQNLTSAQQVHDERHEVTAEASRDRERD